MLGVKNDVLIGIFISGNFKNVLKVYEKVKDLGMRMFSLVGCDGGKMKFLSDMVLIVFSDDIL